MRFPDIALPAPWQLLARQLFGQSVVMRSVEQKYSVKNTLRFVSLLRRVLRKRNKTVRTVMIVTWKN
jgi:hypothetical protein